MSKMTKAIIYVRGNREATQELICKAYAVENGYDVLYVTRDIDEVRNCNVLLISNHSRISRNSFEYYKIINNLKTKGIKVESVINPENADRYIDLITKLPKGYLNKIKK